MIRELLQIVNQHLERAAKIVGIPQRHLLSVVAAGSFAVILAAAVGALLVHPVLWIVAALGLSSAFVTAKLRSLHPKGYSGSIIRNHRRITDAQVQTVLRLSGQRITPSQLSKATNSTLDAAEKKLIELSASGDLVLDTQSVHDELVFVMPPRISAEDL